MKNFSEGIWLKRWAGSYTFISCDYWGRQYSFSLKEYLGTGFDHSLFIHKQGVVSFFLLKEEFEAFGKVMAEVVVQNPTLAHERLAALKENTDKITSVMDRLKGKIPSWEEYQEFLKYYDRHLPLHNFMKKTVDFLPEEEGKEWLPFFKDARMYSEHVYSDTERFFRNLAYVIGEQTHRPADVLTCLTQQELENFLQTKVLPTTECLQERFVCSALFFEKGERTLLLSEDVNDIEKQIFTTLNKAQSLKGKIAFAGEATGTVRIVLDPHNPGEFNEGDILVTGMTRPEFLPLIQKASAIVTDAGGLLCHAAISARELKKPCLVGTEIATGFLKNGQTITVDGVQGMVRVH